MYNLWHGCKLYEVVGSHKHHKEVVITQELSGYVLVTKLPKKDEKRFKQEFIAINPDYSIIERLLKNNAQLFEQLTNNLEVRDGKVYDWVILDEIAVQEEFKPYNKLLSHIKTLREVLTHSSESVVTPLRLCEEEPPQAVFHQELVNSQLLPVGEQVIIRELPFRGSEPVPRPSLT